nr:Ig-like domain-containing protein [Planctomycetota bacterium]
HVVGATISVDGATVGSVAGGGAGAALTVTFTAQATPAIAQAILRNLAFANSSSTPSLALRQLAVVIRDGAGGVSAPAVLTVVVEAVDNPPVVTLPSPGLLYLQGAPPQALDGLATLTDIDTPAYPTGLLVVDFTAGATADDQLTVLSQGTGTGQISVSGSDVLYEGVPIGILTAPGTIAGPLLVRLNASATLAATQALLRQLAFADVAVPPVGGPRTVQVVLTDGAGGTSLPVTSIVTVQAVDVAPTLSLPDPPATWAEHDPPVAIVPGALLGDIDSATFNGGSLTVTGSDAVAGDVLDLRSSGVGAGQVATSNGSVLVSGIAVGTYVGGAGPGATLVVSFGPLSTPGAAQAVLRAVVFSHVGEFTTAQTRSFAVVANDGLTDGNTAGAVVDLVPVDDPPTASAVTFGTIQDLARDGLLVGSDPEGGALTWALASQPAHGSATLLDASTGAVRYTPAAGFTGSDSFTVTVSDGVTVSVPATVTMLVATPLAAARPQVLTSPPREGFLASPLTYDLVADTSLLPPGSDLVFQAVGAPVGVVVTKTGPTTATVTWTATGTPEEHQEIIILISDAVSAATASQAVQVLFHAAAGGSG